MKNLFLNKKYLYIIILGVISFVIYKNCKISSGEVQIFSYIYPINSTSIPKSEIKTFVINLDRSPDRYAQLMPQLDKNKLYYERFSAVDGYKIKIQNSTNGEIFFGSDVKTKEMFSQVNYIISCPSFDSNYLPPEHKKLNLTAGELGVYCSHMEIWNNMVANNAKYTLILEDDALLSPGFEGKLDKIISNLPEDWDMVFLHLETHLGTMGDKTIKHNRYLDKVKANDRHFWCATAYLVNTESAKKLFKLAENFSLPIDIIMSVGVNQKKINAYKSVENIVVPSGEQSVISDMGRPSNYDRYN